MAEKNPDQISIKEQEIEQQEQETPPVQEAKSADQPESTPEIKGAALEEEAVNDLESKLAEAEARAAEYLDGWQRSRAEFANFRRRQEQLQKTMRQQMISGLLEKVIAVLDDQERAFNAIPEEMQDNAWIEGLSIVDKKLRTALEKEGLSEMKVDPGDDFDPYYHQAILHEPSAEFDEGKIIDILQKGYHLKDMVLRPAVVRVSSGKIDNVDECD